MKKIILIGLIVILIAVTFFTGIFIKKGDLASKFYFFKNHFDSDLYKENYSLKIENENLKAELEKNQIFGIKKTAENNSLAVNVFSTYPFNAKNELFIDEGENSGIKKGAGITFGSGIFVGQVVDVSEKFSTVQTVFDPSWQLPVKIGENKVNGLFNGGNDPKITLIEKQIKVGDGVFLASKDFPLYLKIGNISKINESSGGVFKEAIVQVPYNISELESLYLIK